MGTGDHVERTTPQVVDSMQFGKLLLIEVPANWGCPFRCVYCGRAVSDTATTRRRRHNLDALQRPAWRVRGELRQSPTWLLLAGEGDPLLSTRIGEILRKLTVQTRLPVAVRTSGALLGRGAIRAALKRAAAVIVKVDAVDRRGFNRVHRPHKGVHVERHIHGLRLFQNEFAGLLLVETVLIAGFNDDRRSVRRLFETLQSLNPDGVLLHLHAPAEEEAFAERVRDAGGLGLQSGEFPVLFIDTRCYRGGGDAGSPESPLDLPFTMPWEASLHRSRSAILARTEDISASS